jgi:hypothetical protein
MPRFLLGILMLAAVFALSGCMTDKAVPLTTLRANADEGIYVVKGAVRLSGTFHLASDECITLVQAIHRAGGVIPGNEYSDGGNLTAVRVQRIVSGSVVEYTIDASPGARGGTEFMVEPGDYIHVPNRTFSTPVPIPVPYAT